MVDRPVPLPRICGTMTSMSLPTFAEVLAMPGVREECELRGRIGFMAYHGGGLEETTDVIARDAAAASGASYYGVVHPPGWDLHLPSTRVTPEQSERFTTSSTGRYGGIGMQIEQQQGNIVVVRVFPNTPAERAGVVEGDRIIGVGDSSTRNWSTSQVSDALTGPPGTKVTARFARPGVSQPAATASRISRSVSERPVPTQGNS